MADCRANVGDDLGEPGWHALLIGQFLAQLCTQNQGKLLKWHVQSRIFDLRP